MPPSLGQQMVRTAGIFQGLLALPIMVIMAGFTMAALYYTYPKTYIYDFISASCNAIFSAGIIFLVLIQRSKTVISKPINLYFEIGKSVLASVIWLWLLIDTIINPQNRYYHPPEEKNARVLRAALSVFLLFIFFYPTLIWTYYDRRVNGGVVISEGEDEGAGERDTLLSP